MCGIAGAYGRCDEGALTGMLSRIRHRGPDEEGTYYEPDEPMMMGARRLSIIDLADGSQPISNEDGTVTVVFNGEIYNHERLRRRLAAAGHRFETRCDTEVLVHLWEEYGTAMPTYLDGMFAFSVWDRGEETLFLARDRLGIKPLYYADESGQFVWGSELPVLLEAGVDRALDRAAVHDYFALRYTSGPRTLLSSVRKLPPGCSALVTGDGGPDVERYWRPTPERIPASRNRIVELVRHQLRASVRDRLMSDVPLGSFLSGGLDSTAIVALASEETTEPLQTFSVAFQGEEFDESEEARFVADHFGTDHHEETVDLSSMDVFGDVVKRFGEPLADPAVLPTMVLSEYATEHVKVVLTGEGADELFAGYGYHRMLPRHRKLFGRFPDPVYRTAATAAGITPVGDQYLRYFASLASDRTAIRDWVRGYGTPPEAYLEGERWDDGALDERVDEAVAAGSDTLQRLSAYDLRYWLSDDLLYKVDHASMAASLEARVPFLDHAFVQFMYNVPSKYKLRGGDYKPLLGAAVANVVPDRIRRRSKHGFNVPIERWFRDDHEAIERWMCRDALEAAPHLDAERVFALRKEHRRGDASHHHVLWRVLNYVAWYHELIAPER